MELEKNPFPTITTNGLPITTKPLSEAALEAMLDDQRYITVNIAVDLWQLLCNSLEYFNELADELICPESFSLTDISYRVVGVIPRVQISESEILEVVIEVCGLPEEF